MILLIVLSGTASCHYRCLKKTIRRILQSACRLPGAISWRSAVRTARFALVPLRLTGASLNHMDWLARLKPCPTQDEYTNDAGILRLRMTTETVLAHYEVSGEAAAEPFRTQLRGLYTGEW